MTGAMCQRDDDVQRALEALPFAYRDVLLLKEVHRLEYAQIARLLGLSRQAVMERLSSARREMLRRLSDNSPTDSRPPEVSQ